MSRRQSRRQKRMQHDRKRSKQDRSKRGRRAAPKPKPKTNIEVFHFDPVNKNAGGIIYEGQPSPNLRKVLSIIQDAYLLTKRAKEVRKSQ